ncbi:MAG TPA: hypothetical protein VH092_25935 [Urbifossiella sp.]|jgi:hypothetical protein|nr:hypothetical protein [Urbifossiella sp.]
MRRAFFPGLLCGLALAAGCGGGGTPVEGQVVNGGTPYSLADGEGISVLLAQEGGSATASGTAEKDGKFKIAGQNGAGLPPGKYKVSVTHYLPAKGGKADAPVAPKMKTANESWEVGQGNTKFTLDLSKYK